MPVPPSRPWPSGPVAHDAARDQWPAELTGTSSVVSRARDAVQRAANEAGRSLIVAEPGLDAEAVARTIHALGSPPDAPFTRWDCSAGSAQTEEALFGAPTAPRSARSQLLERVEPGALLATPAGGTLFLESVAELPASAQTRLARILRDGEVRGPHADLGTPLALRLVGGAGPDIGQEVESGAFRRDLFRRLSEIRIDVPPLRLRPEDIGAMTRCLLKEMEDPRGSSQRRFTGAALGFLSALPWEGNVRELREVLGRLARAVPTGAVRVEDLLAQVRIDRPQVPARPVPLRQARRQFEREYILSVLRHCGGRMSDAAETLGIQRTNLYRKARQLGIPRGKEGE